LFHTEIIPFIKGDDVHVAPSMIIHYKDISNLRSDGNVSHQIRFGE